MKKLESPARPLSPFSFSFHRVSQLLILPLSLLWLVTIGRGTTCGCGSPRRDLDVALTQAGSDPVAKLGVLMAFYRNNPPFFRGFPLERAMVLSPEGREWALMSLEQALKKKEFVTLSYYFSSLSNPKALSVWTALETLKLLQEDKGLDENSKALVIEGRRIQKTVQNSKTSLIPSFEKEKLFGLLDHPRKNQTQIRLLLHLLSLKKEALDEREHFFVELCAQVAPPLLSEAAKVLL